MPSTKTELRSFLGLCQFYAKFIDHYSDICGPLTNQLKRVVKEPLKWSQEQILSFQNLKDSLSRSPILKLPDQ